VANGLDAHCVFSGVNAGLACLVAATQLGFVVGASPGSWFCAADAGHFYWERIHPAVLGDAGTPWEGNCQLAGTSGAGPNWSQLFCGGAHLDAGHIPLARFDGKSVADKSSVLLPVEGDAPAGAGTQSNPRREASDEKSSRQLPSVAKKKTSEPFEKRTIKSQGSLVPAAFLNPARHLLIASAGQRVTSSRPGRRLSRRVQKAVVAAGGGTRAGLAAGAQT